MNINHNSKQIPYFKKLVILGVLAILALPELAFSHGYAVYPKARQLLCNEGGGFWWPVDGSGIRNKACRDAFVDSDNSSYPFTQLNEFSALTMKYNDLAEVKKSIPNSKLCAAADPKKRGMDIVSTDWQKTPIESGKPITYKFLATAEHNPSFWQIYITKAGVDPKKQALAWEDLELIATQGNIVAVGGYYSFVVNMPKNRSGDAILYTRWQRADPAGEGFYNCSDITFVTK